MMETDTQSTEPAITDAAGAQVDSEKMAPQDILLATSAGSGAGQMEAGNDDLHESSSKWSEQPSQSHRPSAPVATSEDDDGELPDDDDDGAVGQPGNVGEDGEILEDGEIESEEEGGGEMPAGDKESKGNKGEKASSSKSSQKRSEKREDHSRRGHNKKERHSKRRRSKEDAHKENRQKKKRHREHNDFEKSDGHESSGWGSDSRRDKSDRKKDRKSSSPAHDKDGDKRRRGSGDKGGGHHSERTRERENDREKGRDRDKGRERGHRDRHDNHKDRSDRHDKSDKERKDRDRHSKEKDSSGRNKYSDGYDSPPGIYDSPSDEDYEGFNKQQQQQQPETMMSMVEGEYMDPTMDDGDMDMPMLPKNKGKKLKRRVDWRRRDDGEQDGPLPPPKKKPLHQTPMEERPICKFFKEGKCQKGNDCPFNHDYQPNKRLELCKYYVQSYCNRDGCVFLHEEFPCKYYHTGSTCYQGDNCKFSHEPLTEETKIALQHVLKEKEDFFVEEEWDRDNHKKHKKKGLLGDGPGEWMSDEQIHDKLEKMKAIPSIFDIQTHAPGDSPSKPPMNNMSQANNMGGMPGPAFFQNSNMSPQQFNGPPNQNTPPNMPPFMGPGGPGMDGPPPGMMGPGQGPPPMMSGPGGPPVPPGMQGPPMGPPAPMSQAAALVGAILRAAPMLQQYRTPGQVGNNTSMPNNMPPNPNDPRYMSANMMGPPPGMGMDGNMGPPPGMEMPPNMMNPEMGGPPPNMMNPDMSGPPPDMGGPPPDNMMGNDNQMNMMDQGQDNTMMSDVNNQMNMHNQNMGGFNPMMQNSGQDMSQGQEFGQNQDFNQQENQNQRSSPNDNSSSMPPVVHRDPRKAAAQNDPRLNKSSAAADDSDVDLRSGAGHRNKDPRAHHGDEDLRQDVDMRQDDNTSNQGGHTPQQNWDDVDEENEDEIPSHLPPKQREMFLRIRQHTMKMKREKSEQASQGADKQADSKMKMDDDKWYSSDEDEDSKPNIGNMLTSIKSEGSSMDVTGSPSQSSSSINVMQMINAIKSQPSPSNRLTDPRKEVKASSSVQREPTIINSREGDCPWRLCRVLYVKNRIPSNIDLNDSRYKTDPRVIKMLKLQELESGKVIDYTKNVGPVKSEPLVNPNEPKVPDLLDPTVFKSKEAVIPRPELAPFVDPRPAVKSESPKQMDPRVKSSSHIDPRVQNRPPPSVGNITSGRPLDPRLSRQDSTSSVGSASGAMSMQPTMPPSLTRPFDPRLARQNSQGPDSSPNSMDPRLLNRQASSDPRMSSKPDAPSLDMGNMNLGKATDPRLARVLDSEINNMAFQRQQSQPGTNSETDSANESTSRPKLDYRNDPRFRRKHVSEAKNLAPENLGKRFTGQRKSSTEYASPLGGEGGASQGEESGYNSYNRPRLQQQSHQSHSPNSAAPSVSNFKTETTPSSSSSNAPQLSTHDILDSLEIMPPPDMGDPQAPDKNLKDIFKTIDPTASPFC